MRFLKLTIAYDGTNYVGWQIQPNGVSIQSKLEAAWESVCQERIRIVASGRTDSGVHARGQVCSLSTGSGLECQTLARALNACLPEDISVLKIESVPTDFHAIRDCVFKTYRYQLQFGNQPDLFLRRYCWFIRRPLNVDAMRRAATQLMGQHDFASFQAAGSDMASTIRTIMRLDLETSGQGGFQYLDIVAQADGFLYNMVRNIVGSLVQVGNGRQSIEWLAEVLERRDRQLAGPTAPPHGLFLDHVFYGEPDAHGLPRPF